MNFFQEKEKALIKSLIYGFIGGVYFSILFISRTKVIRNGNYQTFYERTQYEHIIDILKTSVIISIIMFVITLFYLYFNQEE